MKRFHWLVLVLVLVVPLSAYAIVSEVTTAIGPRSASGQVTCLVTATQIRASSVGRTSITFQAHDNNLVYIAPSSDITTGNAGVLLGQYSSFTADRTSGDVAWYCIRAGGTNAVIGWTEELR